MENKEVMYHIGLSKKDIEGAKYAILPGDPGRVESIAKFLTDYKKVAVNREYTSYLGTLDKQKVLVISTGMGGPSTAICIEELKLSLDVECAICMNRINELANNLPPHFHMKLFF